MSDPFRITGPAIVSFSGGRTSGYMLHRILEAHGGALPDDVVPVFANTGREMPATLDFVRDCGAAWGVNVVWLEFTGRSAGGFQIVNHNSAARAGEPFEALLAIQSAIPNPVQRSCTQELKIRTIKRYVLSHLRWKHWTNIVGIRADEPSRLPQPDVPEPASADLFGEALNAKKKKKKKKRDRWTVVHPLADGGVIKSDVLSFWREQPFDLRLNGVWEGNCDGCFLKSRAAIMRMHRDYPERMAWWARMEAVSRGTAGSGRFFRNDREPYAALADLTAGTPMLIPDETMIEGGQACGYWCGT